MWRNTFGQVWLLLESTFSCSQRQKAVKAALVTANKLSGKCTCFVKIQHTAVKQMSITSKTNVYNHLRSQSLPI